MLEDLVDVSQRVVGRFLLVSHYQQRHRRSTPFSAGGHLQWCDRTLVEAASVSRESDRICLGISQS